MASDLATELLGPASRAADWLEKSRARWWEKSGDPIAFTIFGEPASKANSRAFVFAGKGENRRPMFIKSAKARAYEKMAFVQVPAQWPVLVGPVAVTLRIWYATERPDIDESLILDVLQGRIYTNDRQVREKHVYHGIDRANPRAEITVQPLVAQQEPLF